ncbi:MerR family DNA-binding transcriptional regulator [Flavonifractor plautii]|nr:MerR family DNA-binding transcriptional regulator [Flavonifractor plautii]
MNQKKQLSILEFSRLTGISRDNLRFYDRIGLLCPEQRGENNYRYYARSQLNSAYLISSLRLLEVGLEDIRRYSTGRTPERMLAFFAQQEERIQAEIARLRETSEIMKLRASLAQEALAHAEGAYLLEDRPRERIFCVPRPGRP